MAKQFKNDKEFTEWIESKKDPSFEAMLNGTNSPSDEEYLKMLLEEGYTDLDNLVADGHAYSFCGHSNDGWAYRDEIDQARYFLNDSTKEIRNRRLPVTINMRPSLRKAAEAMRSQEGFSELSLWIEYLMLKNCEISGYVIESRKAGITDARLFIFPEYSYGDVRGLAQLKWKRFSDEERAAYQQDPDGCFRVYAVKMNGMDLYDYEEHCMDKPLSEYETSDMWRAF